MRKSIILFALLTLSLAACRVETNFVLDIAEDGSAGVGAEVGFDEEFAAVISESGGSPGDIFGDLPSFGDNEVIATERVEGDMTYYGVTTNVQDLSAFDMASAGMDVFSTFSYEFDDSSATLRAEVLSADLGELTGGELPIDPSQITDDFFSANVIITMPGTVTEHNADLVLSDGTLVWSIPLDGSIDIVATSSFGSGNANWILFLLIALLVIGIAAAIVATLMSRRQSQDAVAAAAEPAPDDDDPTPPGSGSNSTDEDTNTATGAAEGEVEGESEPENATSDPDAGDDSTLENAESEKDSKREPKSGAAASDADRDTPQTEPETSDDDQAEST